MICQLQFVWLVCSNNYNLVIICCVGSHKFGTALGLICSAGDGQRPPVQNPFMYVLIDNWQWWSLAKDPEIHLSATSRSATGTKCRNGTSTSHGHYRSAACWEGNWAGSCSVGSKCALKEMKNFWKVCFLVYATVARSHEVVADIPRVRIKVWYNCCYCYDMNMNE